MKLHELELSDADAAGLRRLLEKMGVSAAASRDSSDLCRRTFGVEVRAGSLDKEARSVDVVASTNALDSYDEIVEQDWDLRRYQANPVVLYAHNAVGLCGPAEDTLPIGFASAVAVVNGQLHARLHFVDEKANPMAERVWQGFQQGSLRAVSVGFRPHRSFEEETDGRKIVHLSQNELFEISACPIPANPEAVARSIERNRAQALRLAAKDQPSQGKTNMDAEKKIAELETQVAALKSAAEGHAAALTDAQKRASDAETARAEAEKRATSAEERADAADKQLNVLEVEKLVGKKLLPAEVDEFVELRATNRKLYDKMIAKRSDLPHGRDVIPPDPNAENKAASDGGDSDELTRLAKDKTASDEDDLAALAKH